MATDKLFYKLATDHPAAILKLLNVPDYDDYHASSFSFKEIENRRDVIFEKRTGDEAILLEAQGYDDAYFYHRAIVGKMLYHIQKQFTGKLRTVVIFLEQSHQAAASKLAHHFDGSIDLAFQPTIFILSQTNVSHLEKLDDIHLVPLYPLCNVTPEQIQTTAPVWAERIKSALALSEKERHDLLSLLGGFIIHRIKELTLADISKFIGDFKMEDTRAGQELIAIGYDKGIEKGIEKGLEKGLEEGLEKGEKLGSVKTLRENIIDLISIKWNEPTDELLEDLDELDDTRKLKSLYHALLKAKSRKQMKHAFETALGNGKKGN